MKKSRTLRTVLSLVFVAAMLFNGLSVAAVSDDPKFSNTNRHISEDAFTGLEGREITTLGTAGINYTIVTPDRALEKEIYIGFDPRMTDKDSYYNSLYDIGAGWSIKIPYIEFSEDGSFLHPGRDGYKLEINGNPDEKQYIISNYPGSYTFSWSSINGEELYSWEKPYSHQEYFSLDGKIVKIIDTFGKTTEYFYKDDAVYEIAYPDGSAVCFEREDSVVYVKYRMDDEIETIATLYLKNYSENVKVLSSIESSYGNNIQFEYEELTASDCLLLASYAIDDRSYGKYSRLYKYEADSYRLEELTTIYEDESSMTQEYYYNSDGRLERNVNSDMPDFIYKYALGEEESLSVETTQISIDGNDVSSRTLNKYAQLTHYSSSSSNLELKYDKNNSVVEEKENELIVTHTYTEKGLPQTASFSTGEKIAYEYYSDGSMKKKTTDTREIYYAQNGRIEKEIIDGQAYVYSVGDKSGDTVSLMAVTKAYDIDSQVFATNYVYEYNLNQYGFNCYTFALKRTHEINNPGYKSNSGVSKANITLSAIKTCVLSDAAALGKTTYSTTNNASIPGNQWKIALRVKPANDFHFMRHVPSDSSSWRFKAGGMGPVMELQPNKSANNITWDTYKISNGDFIVDASTFYTSGIEYIMFA